MELKKRLKTYKSLRKLSKREWNLLILLGFTIILFVFYRFIIPYQQMKIKSLESQKQIYQEKIEGMSMLVKREDDINIEIASLGYEKIILSNGLFFNVEQSEILNIVNELLENENIEIQDIVFNLPSEENIGELTVNRLVVNIPYKGNYAGVLEVIKSISSYPKKILIDDLTLDRADDGSLHGTITLSFYSLNKEGQASGNVASVDVINIHKDDPFEPFDGYGKIEVEYPQAPRVVYEYTEGVNENEANEVKDIKEIEHNRVILEDFENNNFSFISANGQAKGNILLSSKSKSKDKSLRLEYDISAAEESVAYIDMSAKMIKIINPPDSLGLWVCSYKKSPIKLGFLIKAQKDELLDFTIADDISWIGWHYVEIRLPQDLSLYPLLIDKIYIELGNNKEDYGVLLFDKLEANYPNSSNRSNNQYLFHVVEKGDTLDSISLRYYQTTDKKNLIIKYNELESEELRPGKVLIIPKD